MSRRDSWWRRLFPFRRRNRDVAGRGRARGHTAARAERASEATLGELERRALDAWGRGHAEKAIRALKRAHDRFPTDPDVAFLAGELLLEMDAIPEAARAFDAARRLMPEDPHAPALLGCCRLHLRELDGAREAVAESLARDPDSPDGLYWEAVLRDLDGDGPGAMRRYRAAAAGAPDDYFVPFRVPRKRFQRLVEHALEAIERDIDGFAEALAGRNVNLRLRDTPSEEQIRRDGFSPLWLGVFEGWSGAESSIEDPWSGMPGWVVLFQHNIDRGCRTLDELREQIRLTLLHEVAHAHGREEDWMEPRGLA